MLLSNLPEDCLTILLSKGLFYLEDNERIQNKHCISQISGLAEKQKANMQNSSRLVLSLIYPPYGAVLNIHLNEFCKVWVKIIPLFVLCIFYFFLYFNKMIIIGVGLIWTDSRGGR